MFKLIKKLINYRFDISCILIENLNNSDLFFYLSEIEGIV